MKRIINNKRYDTDNCEILAKRDHRSSSGNYAGTTYLLVAKDGTYLWYTNADGQGGYLRTSVCACEDATPDLDGMQMTDEQEARCVELGILEVV